MRHFELAAIPARERRAVLRNLLVAWAPFDQSDYAVLLRGDNALAYAWDALNPSLATSPVGRRRGALWPESILREPLQRDGTCLVACLEGVEAQYWRGGLPVASRWWPQRPDATQWQEFLRSLGPAADGVDVAGNRLPGPAAAPQWLAGPWSEPQGLDELASNWSRLERVTVGVAVVGLAALSGAQVHQLWSAHEQRETAQVELDRVRLAAGPVLAARDRALAQARELERLSSQLNAVQPLELLQHLARLLPAKGVLLKEFELQGDRLRLGLDLAPDVQRSALVKELQAGGWFANVAEQREVAGRGWVTFEMNLKGMQPPVLSDRPGEAQGARKP